MQKSDYDFLCSAGHVFSLKLTKEEFVSTKVKCKCGRPAKRKPFAAGVRSGTIIPGTRVEYPHYNWQLPVQPGQKLGEPNVMSKAHENDIIAGKLGDRYERNQL